MNVAIDIRSTEIKLAEALDTCHSTFKENAEIWQERPRLLLAEKEN